MADTKFLNVAFALEQYMQALGAEEFVKCCGTAALNMISEYNSDETAEIGGTVMGYMEDAFNQIRAKSARRKGTAHMRANSLTELLSIEDEQDLVAEIEAGYFDIDIDALNSLDYCEEDFNTLEMYKDDLYW